MNIQRYFRVLLPDFWVMLGQYSRHLDRAINDRLDAGAVPQVASGGYQIELDGLRLWGQNFPYGYAEMGGFRPSRRTILRLCDEVERALFASPAK